MKYDIQGIKRDRDKGMALRPLAKKWSISVNTIRKILDDTSTDISISKTSAVEEIYTLAIRGEGILYSEEKDILYKHNIHSNKEVRKAVRRLAEKDGEEVLFIPDWIGRKDSRLNRDVMMELADNLNRQIEECVSVYVQETGKDSNDVRYTLLSLAVEGFNPIPITKMCDGFDEVVRKLEIK